MLNKHEELPKKSCTIEKLVTIPEDVDKVLQGEKTATRRSGVYADIGEIMELKGTKFKVEHIYSQLLGEVTDEDAQAEGYENFEAYKDAILSIHPGMKWAPQMRVWVHEYAPVNA